MKLIASCSRCFGISLRNKRAVQPSSAPARRLSPDQGTELAETGLSLLFLVNLTWLLLSSPFYRSWEGCCGLRQLFTNGQDAQYFLHLEGHVFIQKHGSPRGVLFGKGRTRMSQNRRNSIQVDILDSVLLNWIKDYQSYLKWVAGGRATEDLPVL